MTNEPIMPDVPKNNASVLLLIGEIVLRYVFFSIG